jgi:hypothetical protein
VLLLLLLLGMRGRKSAVLELAPVEHLACRRPHWQVVDGATVRQRTEDGALGLQDKHRARR